MKIKLLVMLLLLASCQPRVEFYIDGIPCYTKAICTKYEVQNKYGWHFGLNPWNFKYEYHLGWYVENECVDYRIDTIKIKEDE